MTACAIEDGTAEAAAGTDETVEPESDEPDGAAEAPDPARGAAGPAEPVAPGGPPEHHPDETVLPAFTLTADGAYAARLTAAARDDVPGTEGDAAGPEDDATGPEGRSAVPGDGAAGRAADGRIARYAERWTLDGPEPYAVRLPLDRPEEAGSQVLPLADGRVLIRRRVAADRHTFSLLYPTGPGTGELPLGAVERTELTLLPPSPDGVSAYALSAGEYSTGLWRVAGGAFGPEHVADLPGRCSGGVWLDRAGRLLALDREPAGGGPVKAVAVDLGRGAEMTPLLQIAPDSDDRLLLADPDSGLLLIRSDAPGHDRIGWGVLGSCLPVRFPECLRPPDVAVTPFAVQPGQMLMPESCAVALRIDGAAGSWVGVWRPSGRRLHQLAAPGGWLAGSGVWSRDGVLKLPYADGDTPCALAYLTAPADVEPSRDPASPGCAQSGTRPSAAVTPPAVCRPVPLGQAPLVGRTAPD